MTHIEPPSSETREKAQEAEGISPESGIDFAGFLRGVPALYGLLGAAIAAVVNLLVLKWLLPEPLGRLDVFSSILILVALLVGWVGRRQIRRHLGKVITLTSLSAVLLVAANAFLVCEVPYTINGETVQRNFLTGWGAADADLQGLACSEAIRMVGNTRDDLRSIWGGSFDLALAGYTLLYLGILFGVVVSLASLQNLPAKVTGEPDEKPLV